MTDMPNTGSGRSSVDLPAEVDDDFDVYVNSILQTYDVDYHVEGRTLVFPRTLIHQRVGILAEAAEDRTDRLCELTERGTRSSSE